MARRLSGGLKLLTSPSKFFRGFLFWGLRCRVDCGGLYVLSRRRALG